MRDDIRMRVHLANLDAQEAWKKLEPSLGDLEQKLNQVTDATKAAAQDLLDERLRAAARWLRARRLAG